MLSLLPPELFAAVVDYLDLRNFLKCREVCKEWNVLGRSEFLLKSFCQRLGFLSPGQTLEDVRQPRSRPAGTPLTFAHIHSRAELDGRPAADLLSYEAFWKSSLLLQDAWPASRSANYKGSVVDDGDTAPSKPSVLKSFHLRMTEGDRVCGFQYDRAEDCFILTRYREEGLSVICSSTGEHLMYCDDVERGTKIQHSEGWVVYGHRSDLLVWKFERLDETIVDPRRGVLTPCGSIKVGGLWQRPFTFDFPILMAVNGNSIVVCDVAKLSIVQKIKYVKIVGPDFGLVKKYNEALTFDEDYIFATYDTLAKNSSSSYPNISFLHVYSRASGELVCVLDTVSLNDRARCFDLVESEMTQKSDDWKSGAHWEAIRTAGVPKGHWNRAQHDVLHDVKLDATTGSLCLLSTGSLSVIPEYKSFIRAVLTSGCPEQVLLLNDFEDSVFGLRLPQRVYEYPKYGGLAVSNGRIARMYTNNLVIVDLREALRTFSCREHLNREAVYFSKGEYGWDKHTLIMDAASLTMAGHRSYAGGFLYPARRGGFPLPSLGIEVPGPPDLQPFYAYEDPNGMDELDGLTISSIVQFDFDHLAKSPREDRQRWLEETGGDRGVTLCYPVLPPESEAELDARVKRLDDLRAYLARKKEEVRRKVAEELYWDRMRAPSPY